MMEDKAVNSNDSNDTLGFSSSFLESLRAAQESDPELTIIRSWCQDGTQPSEDELFLSSIVRKNYWINRELFLMDSKRVLCRKNKNNLDHEVLVILACPQLDILNLGHNIPSAAHQSVDRTLNRLKG